MLEAKHLENLRGEEAYFVLQTIQILTFFIDYDETIIEILKMMLTIECFYLFWLTLGFKLIQAILIKVLFIKLIPNFDN